VASNQKGDSEKGAGVISGRKLTLKDPRRMKRKMGDKLGEVEIVIARGRKHRDAGTKTCGESLSHTIRGRSS